MTISDATEAKLEAFHSGLYLDTFRAQQEPLAVWQRARRGELPYRLWVRLSGEDGGIAFERYPETGCGLLTYLVVAPHARGRGIGKRLVEDALGVLHDAPAIYAEVNDPVTQQREPALVAQQRLAMFERWGARVVEMPYVQPALAAGLAPDTTLRLIAWGDRSPALASRFLAELSSALTSHTGTAEKP